MVTLSEVERWRLRALHEHAARVAAEHQLARLRAQQQWQEAYDAILTAHGLDTTVTHSVDFETGEIS